MANTIQRAEYFYATVEDKPGKWHWLLQYFQDNEVNLRSFTAFPVGNGKTQLDFFPENPEHLQRAAGAADITLHGPKRAFLVQGVDEAGSLIEYHVKLSNAGINVHAANGVSSGKGRFGYVLWVKPSDYDKAALVLGL